MKEKVTLRFEQFDETDDNSVLYQGPVSIYETVNEVSNLYELSLPEIDEEEKSIVVFVKNTSGHDDDQLHRGAYFRYNYTSDSWQEILLGTHSHGNKEMLDKITMSDIGTWINLTQYSSTLVGISGLELPDVDNRIENSYYLLVGNSMTDSRRLYKCNENNEWVELEKNTNTLFIDTENYILYKANRIKNSPGNISMNWNAIPMEYGIQFPMLSDIKTAYYRTDLEELYIFSGARVGDRKALTLEVTDPDNTDFTYSYDVAWTELPEQLPIIPNDIENDSYLGVEPGTGKPIWKNSFVPSQTFQVKKVFVEDYEGRNPRILHVSNIEYNPDLDEILVISGFGFVYDRVLNYNSDTKLLEVLNNVADFDIGDTITIIVIRNGTSSVMDRLAADYLTKAEAISLLSGGSVNLRNYATKTDLQSRALRDHQHSGYSRVEHDHDNRYANFRHTHTEYLTRRKVLELLQETLEMNPNILTILEQISTSLENSNLEDFVTSVTMQNDIIDIKDRLDEIKNIHFDPNEIRFFFNSYIKDYYGLRTDQIVTEYLDPAGEPKNLSQILQDIKDDIDSNLRTVETNKVLLNSPIQVRLDNPMGSYNDGDVIAEGSTLQSILEKLVKIPDENEFKDPELIVDYEIEEFPEIGDSLQLTITSEYHKYTGGNLFNYIIEADDGNFTNILLESNRIRPYTGTLNFQDLPVTISTRASYYLKDGVTEKTFPTVTKRLTPVRAVFYGSLNSVQELDSRVIRSFKKYTNSTYKDTEIDYEVPVGSRMILFAIPINKGTLKEIQYKEQSNTDILSTFEQGKVIVEAANNIIGIMYNLYYYELPFPTQNKLHLKFLL